MNISKLIEQAKLNSNVESDRALAKLLGVSHGVPSQWRTGISIPKPEHSQKLADLAGIDPAPFVIETMIQSTKDTRLISTLERFKRAVAAFFVMGATLSALIEEMAAYVYYVKIKQHPLVKTNSPPQTALGPFQLPSDTEYRPLNLHLLKA